LNALASAAIGIPENALPRLPACLPARFLSATRSKTMRHQWELMYSCNEKTGVQTVI